MRTALLLLWDGSAYDSLRAILRLVAAELEAEGFGVETVTVDRRDWMADLRRALREETLAFAMGLSGIGSDIRDEGGRLLWEAAGVPFFNWNCDHPCYFPPRHKLQSPFLRQGYVFPDHAAYAARHLGPGATAFAVHLGMPRRDLFPGAPLPGRDRAARLLFVKSGADPRLVLARWREMRRPMRDILPEAAEGSTADVLAALQRAAEPRGLHVDGASPLALSLVRELDAYLRFRRADLVLSALRPYPVDVFGTGWGHVDWEGARASFRGMVDFADMNAMLPHYLGSVSTNPLVDGSVHDRVTFALAAGVVPLSDANMFWRTRMPALSPYGFAFEREAVAAAVEALLGDPEAGLARAEATYRTLDPVLSLRESVRTIVDIAALPTR